MDHLASTVNPLDRRAALRLAGAAMTALTLSSPVWPKAPEEARTMKVTCFIRYQIDPFQKDGFRQYAETWGPIIPRLGGHLIGYFLPHEGTNDIAFALIAFASLGAYEVYRERLRQDPEARQNLAFAESRRLILREERSFLELAEGAFNRPAADQ